MFSEVSPPDVRPRWRRALGRNWIARHNWRLTCVVVAAAIAYEIASALL